MAFLPAAPMGLRASSAAVQTRSGRTPLSLRMQQATVDREQDVGIGQDSMRKDAEALMQPCPLTKYSHRHSFAPRLVFAFLLCYLFVPSK